VILVDDGIATAVYNLQLRCIIECVHCIAKLLITKYAVSDNYKNMMSELHIIEI
jgi:hypothetical protein